MLPIHSILPVGGVTTRHRGSGSGIRRAGWVALADAECRATAQCVYRVG